MDLLFVVLLKCGFLYGLFGLVSMLLYEDRYSVFTGIGVGLPRLFIKKQFTKH